MRSAYSPTFQDSARTLVRRRGVSLVLVIVIHVLLLLMLLRLAPPQDSGPPRARGLTTLQLLPESRAEPTKTKAAAKAQRTPSGATRATLIPKPIVQLPRPPGSSSSGIWSKVMPLTREEMASADLSRMPSHTNATASADAGADGDSKSTAGGGPHGERLYDADWYRHPTQTELAAYLSKDAPPEGWGEIACKTVAGFRVEDCVELGQSPPGSGFARAVLQAAWQFRVLPPRIGGRPMIGTWVRIRIDYIEGEVEGG